MAYEAARVQYDAQGKEVADYPQCFENIQDAQNYVKGTPVSADGNRPWIRDITKPAIGQFLMSGGKEVSSSVVAKERLYRTARIRTDIGFDHIQGMLPGDVVAVKYWKHEYDVTSGGYRPIYFIAKTNDFERHIAEGAFSTVFNSALEAFCL